MRDAPQHATVFEDVVKIQHFVGVKLQGHHLAFWTVREHEWNDHCLWWPQVNGVDMGTPLTPDTVIVAVSFGLRGEDVVSLKLIARGAHHRVVKDFFLHVEAIALLVHVPASNHAV